MPQPNDQPYKLATLGLYHHEINHIINAFVPQILKAPVYKGEIKPDMVVRIIDLNQCYFAKINCDYIGDIKNKEAFIEEMVTEAIKALNLASKTDNESPLTYKEIAVGAVISCQGRSAPISSFLEYIGKIPDNHAYVVFKVPGEDKVLIEDPRTGVFSREIKLQSRTNSQICSFAASAIFYFCYRSLFNKEEFPKTTQSILKRIYGSPDLKEYMQEIEKKVGTTAKKKQVIKEFIEKIPTLRNIVLGKQAAKISENPAPAVEEEKKPLLPK
jgi:hypothetical protein